MTNKEPYIKDSSRRDARLHCHPAVAVLAYIATGYLGASVLYLVLTRCMGLGTPFKDTLSAEQRRVLAASKKSRGRVFGGSALICATLLLLLRPLG